jgi:hypothetical protein
VDTPALITGAIGGIATLVAKYIIDRFAEANKASLGVAAKRKERLDEKQAMVISGLYHKVERCVEDLSELYFHGDEAGLDATLSQAVEQQLGSYLDKAEKSLKQLRAFHSKYCLYLPEHLDEAISRVILTAESHIGKFQEELLTKEFSEIDRAASEEIKDLRFNNILLLIELKKRFRQLLLGDPKTGLIERIVRQLPLNRRPKGITSPASTAVGSGGA